MSATGTRPPLFDPEPGSFDDDVDPPRFPHRPTGRRSSPRPAEASPRWVRPFLLGGLILIALLSLLSFLGGGDGDAPASSAATSAATDPAATDPAAADPVTAEPVVAEDATGAAAPATAPPADDTADDTADAAEVAALPADGGPSGVPTADDATLLAARAFAAQFAHDYLNLDEANPEIRQRNLRAYLAPGLDPQLGWDGTGTQVAVLTVPIEATRTGDGATVVVAAQVTGRDAPRWVHLAVPVAQDERGRWAVVAPPAYVPRPAAGSPVLADAGPVDAELSSELQPAVRALFTAFAADEVVELDGVTSPDAAIRGLDGQVQLVDVGTLQVRQGDGPTRTAEVTVTWRDDVTVTTLAQRYVLDLVDVEAAWLVEAVTAG